MVCLPPGEDFNDWLAVHVVDFFNRINLIYGTVCEQCTATSCPTMSGGPKYEYLWQDGIKFKKPTHLPASQYIEFLMDWIETQINDENIFPVTTDVPFPKTFQVSIFDSDFQFAFTLLWTFCFFFSLFVKRS